MKKLNVTKEQFNRSNYFQRKYGKLEYVSESGRLFKTNKGKVLKFKESTMEPEDKFGEKYENFIVALEKYGSHGQVHMFGPENMYVSIPRLGIKDVYDEVDKIRMAAEEVGWSIPPEGVIEKSIMNDRRIAAEIDIIPVEEDLTGEYNESTRKARRSARRFNESDERKTCRSNIIRAYDSLEQAIRDYGSILEGRQCKQASKVEAKIHDIIAGFLADTSNS